MSEGGLLPDEVTPDRLRALRAQLLEAEIRSANAEAEIAELELIERRVKEEDRLARAGAARSMNFFAPVVPEVTDEYIAVLDHWRRRNSEPIEINLNSPGGGVVDGFGFYDAIQRCRRSGIHVVTRATGMAASMAAVILQGGSERIIDRNALLMIHEVSASVRGKTSEMLDTMVGVNLYQDRALDILADRSTMTRSAIARKWKKTDWYLDADDALKLGFVDRVE